MEIPPVVSKGIMSFLKEESGKMSFKRVLPFLCFILAAMLIGNVILIADVAIFSPWTINMDNVIKIQPLYEYCLLFVGIIIGLAYSWISGQQIASFFGKEIPPNAN